MLVLLDADVLSALLRQHPAASACGRTYLGAHGRFTLSAITRYEILRGLLAKRATKQTSAFDRFCDTCEILSITDAILARAAGIYADLHREGWLIGDADIIVAATALMHGFGVATNNVDHFQRTQGLRVENWLA